ncbi:Hypothetical predicted protein [Olea europaea subsp. europaea]|uniref:Uncharacterized protein n=1 Tax=Olea europaea subsp. europaea TaxID=158383 RepID=A0A8S0TZQ3_OLEEU|nr:Hypothetical predicted protein [Olea europaea subsp. europaea]
MKKKEKAISNMIHDFPIVVQIWTFEMVLEIGDRFGQHLGEHFPLLLGWTSTKQPQQRTYDAFFNNLHVYSTLWPTEAEQGQPHIATLVSFNDRPIPALDDHARDSVAPQFHAECLCTLEESTSEDDTSNEAHEGSGTSYEEEESGADDSREVEDYGGFANYAGHHRSLDGPDKDMGIDRQEEDGMCITEEHMEPCPDEQDMPLPTETESLQGTTDIAHIQPCPDNHPVPVSTRTEEVQVEGGHHPSPDDRDEEQDMLPSGTEHLQDTADIESYPDNDPVSVPTGTDEVQSIPSFIEN